VRVEFRVFPPFRLDLTNAQLWQGSEEIHLRRKTFEVLRYLVERPGQLATKAALLDAVWPDVSVSDSVPAISVRELRKVLGDSAQTPRFIETVQRRGYRFIAIVKVELTNGSTSVGDPLGTRSSRNLFVGREHERWVLQDAMADAASGRGRFVLISGEPGVGKTRVCAEFAIEARAKGVEVLIGHCMEQDAVPYLPFVEILETCVDQAQSPEELRRMVESEGPELGRLLPKLKRILPDLSTPPELPPEQARRQLFECFCQFVAHRSRKQPLLLFLEDLHWADDSTLALVTYLSRRQINLPLLVIGTHRESAIDVSEDWSRSLEDLVRSRNAIQIRLHRLVRGEVAEMLTGLSGQAPPDAIVTEIYAETDGNPLFVEELFRHLAEENRLYDATGRFRAELKIDELEVPRNVRLIVGRRVAKLGEVTGKILAVAAVIGHFFSSELLEAAAGASSESILECLDKAEHAGLIAPASQPSFEFSHELIRQAVLSGLSAARRQRFYLDVAEAVERIHSDTLEDHYAVLAHHYAQTAKTWKAVKYSNLAGKQAIQRSAYADAVSRLNAGLGLLVNLPQTPERDREELALQLSIGPALRETKGYAATEMEQAFRRAAHLAQRVNDTSHLFAAQHGLALLFMMKGAFGESQRMAHGLLPIATDAKVPAQLLTAHAMIGVISFWMGKLQTTAAHLDQAIAVYETHPDANQGIVGCFTYGAWTRWHLGFPDQALERAQRAQVVAKQLAQPFSLAQAFCQTARLHMFRREAKIALELGQAASTLANELGSPTWGVEANMIVGWGLAFNGREAEGIAQLQEALAARRALGEAAQPHFTSWLVEAYAKAERYEDGLALLAEALEPPHEVLVYEPELYRLKGELVLLQGASNVGVAERCFRTAIEMAQGNHAKALELRATTSLARLLAKQEKHSEARTMLAEIYNWFTEGFDTVDLKDAKLLLDESKE